LLYLNFSKERTVLNPERASSCSEPNFGCG
jgi:hypothetical protein